MEGAVKGRTYVRSRHLLPAFLVQLRNYRAPIRGRNSLNEPSVFLVIVSFCISQSIRPASLRFFFFLIGR